MIFRLIILTGDRKGRQITVERTPMVIGQDPSSAICIPDEEVARRHASIVHREDGKLVIQDLGSMNRILVNGRAVSEAQLKHGDTIELGRTRLLVQALVQAEMDAPPKPAPVEDDLLPRHRFPIGLVMNGLLVAALAVAVVTWHRSTRSYRAPQPVPNPLALDTYLATPISNTVAPADAAVHLPPVTPEDMLAGTGLLTTATFAAPVLNVFTAAVVATPPVATEKLDRIEQELASLRVTMQGLSNNRPAIAQVAMVTNAPIPPTPPPQPQPPRAEAAAVTNAPIPPAPPAQTQPPRAEAAAVTNAPIQPAPLPKPKPASHTASMVPRSRPPAPAPADLLMVALTDLRQNKFPATEEFDEMRVVSADLQATPANAPIDSLRCEVTFFDRLDRDGTIVPSQAIVTPSSMRSAGEPGAGKYSAGATYVVPRRADKAPLRAASYYGFAVRIYDGKRLLATDARPRHLLGAADAARKSTP